jgi:hypothetical protein
MSLGGVAQVFPSQTTRGRSFSNGQAFTFLNIVEPGVKYGDPPISHGAEPH